MRSPSSTSGVVGRQGFDDGLAISSTLPRLRWPRPRPGPALRRPGFSALYLTNAERQRIFDDDMAPLLAEQRFDDALRVALARIDAAATAEKAAQLQLARQVDAVIGIAGGLGGFLVLAGIAFFHWRRYGRDPYVVDSPSIYLPAPPQELTAAGGALLFDGHSSRRTLTTALLDLASRDELAFRPKPHLLARDEVTVELHQPQADDPRIRLNRRHPVSPAESYVLRELGDQAVDAGEGVRKLERDELLAFGKSVAGFDQRLESELVRRGWFTEAPHKAANRWRLFGGLEIVAAVVAFWLATSIPSSGFTLLAAGLGAAGLFTFAIAGAMPARTLTGAHPAGDCWRPIAARSRPPSSGRAPWSRSSPSRASPGWRRQTAPSSGRSPSGCSTRWRRSSNGAWRTSARAGPARRTCRFGTAARGAAPDPAAWAAWHPASWRARRSRISAACSQRSARSATRPPPPVAGASGVDRRAGAGAERAAGSRDPRPAGPSAGLRPRGQSTIGPRPGTFGPAPEPIRYTRAMGAVDTMEVFFEELNAGRAIAPSR